MKVFADFHHFDLYYSLQLLFEKRLGFELYRPIGTEWATSGYWKIAEPYGNNPDTVRQFLGLDTHKWESGKFLNGDYHLEDGVYYIFDPIHQNHQKAITLETFSQMDFDLVISSIPAHDVSFSQLIRDRMPRAKHIAQMGNSYQTTDVKNVMCSCSPYPVPEDKNVVFYHQEFPLDVFSYKEPIQTNLVSSFVNCLPKQDVFNLFEASLPELKFSSYGIGNRDGTVTGLQGIADIMQNSLFGYHVKPGGDGFGHIIHNWFASGRPVIIEGNDYRDKLAGNLLQDGVTCVDLDKHSFNESIDLIRRYSEPGLHKYTCEQVRKRFDEVVNFDQEENLIKSFLESII